MENIISYFGTYTPAADGAIANFKFEYLCTLGFAAIVIFLGRAIVAHSAALRKYAIPAPVVSGIIFSLLISAIKMTGTVSISFDAKVMKDLCQNLFFLCVGFGFSAKMLRHAGGKLCVMIAFAACLLITCQDVLGVAIAHLINLNPLLALQCSSSAMSGGVGTASAFGPIFEGWGAQDATTIGVAAGTLGNVMGSLIGGPVAAFLIAKHGLKADPNDKPEAKATGKAPVVSAFPGYTDTAVIAGTTGNCNCLSYGPGTLAMAHKADEYVDEADIRRCQKVYETLLEDWLWK